MDKKVKKEYAKVIILGILIAIFAISIVFTSHISSGIRKVLLQFDVRVNSNDLVVHYIDVGQGDAIALNFPNGEIMMIDAGPKDNQNNLVKYIKDQVLKDGKELNIDYLILTHPDIDHSGGVCVTFQEFDVKNFYRPNIASLSESVSDFVLQSSLEEYDEAIKLSKQENNLNIEIVNKELDFNIGKARVQIFPPAKLYGSTNEMSCVVKVSYLGKSFLFTGDIEEDNEKDLLAKYGDELNADVLKVAHHGSTTSSSEEFVNMVSPEYAIICVGPNIYGHPNFMVVSRFESVGAKVLTTLKGNIRFVCNTDFFGVMDNYVVHSYAFVKWWVIALVAELALITSEVICVIRLIKKSKQELI